MDFTKKMPDSVNDLERLYQDTDSGHWFDKSTMKFFKCRLPGDFRRIDDKTALFISTEQGPSGGPRRATVRIARIVDFPRDGGDMISRVEIDTVGLFNKMTMNEAKKFMEAWNGES